MTICVNGCPKMGTHALLKAVELLGQPADEVHHIPYGESLPAGTTKHLFIVRDPRNTMMSWLRFTGHSVTQGTFMAVAQESPLKDQVLAFAGWVNDPNTYVVKFEDLIANDVALRGIADFLGVPYLDDAFPNLPGFTITWTGDYSDYNKIWTPALEAFWQANGGPELMAAYGYTS